MTDPCNYPAPESNYSKMLRGEDYIPNEPEFFIHSLRANQLAEQYRLAFLEGNLDKCRIILKELFNSVGEGVMIKPPFYIDFGDRISIGARTFINYNLTALDVSPISIGEDCQIAPNVQLLTPIHAISSELRKNKHESGKPIIIGNNVWLGGGAVVCPGVTVGDNTIIGAGSVVTKNIPHNVIAAGDPARIIREID